VIALALYLAASGPAAPQWNCADPGPQQEMNYCAAQDFNKADGALNAQWKKTAAEMKRRDAEWDAAYDKRPGYFATLLDAQRAWIKYRDAHCTTSGYLFRGGSMESFMVSTCKTGLTNDRTQQLQFLIEQ